MIRPAPRTGPPRNGIPEPVPYRWRGGLADDRTPAEIVADLHDELAARRRKGRFVTLECLARDCPACTDARCRCPCHDDDAPLPIPVAPEDAPESSVQELVNATPEAVDDVLDDADDAPLPVPPPARCRRCGYLTGAPGHAVSCPGGGR